MGGPDTPVSFRAKSLDKLVSARNDSAQWLSSFWVGDGEHVTADFVAFNGDV